ISRKTLDAINAYNWPGNVRELRHAVERAMIMSGDDSLDAEELLMNNNLVQKQAGDNIEHSVLNDISLEQLEQEAIRQALKKHHGNISKTAKALGITRTSLYRR